jgi:hypothetical protein
MKLECWYRPFPLSPDFLKDKYQLVLVYTMNLYRGEAIQLHSFFTFVLDRGERSVKRTGESVHRVQRITRLSAVSSRSQRVGEERNFLLMPGIKPGFLVA